MNSAFKRSSVSRVSSHRAIFGLLLGVALISTLFFRNRAHENLANVYEETTPQEILDESKIRFEEVALDLGIKEYSEVYFPNPEVMKSDRALTLTALHPAVAIVDVDRDGFMDIYTTLANPKPNHLYINNGGRSFTDRAVSYGLDETNQTQVSGSPIFADFTGDGILDAVVGKYGCHKFFVGQGPNKPFIERTEMLDGYCSNPHAANVFDFNRDGKLDLIFGNYFPDEDLAKQDPSANIWVNLGDNEHGGKDVILENRGSGFRKSSIDFKNRSLTNSVGILDINGDGWMDLMFGHSRTTDEVWVNDGGKNFTESTEQYTPRRFHGYAGMNSEVMDLNQDGKPDMYVTNAYQPSFGDAQNLLWMSTPEGRYERASEDMNVGRCGFSWGAKFADFNLDGDLDLMVVNGRMHSPQIKAASEGRSFWYELSLVLQAPYFLRKALIKEGGSDRIYLGSFQPSCLFEWIGGQFHNIATHAGIRDTEDGKGLALIDYDNDGKMDFIVMNSGGPTLLYHNVSEVTGHWIGFSLEDKNGSEIPVGASVQLTLDSSPKPLERNLYPNNGYRGQSDPRFLFGIGESSKPVRLVVNWPSGKVESFTEFKIDSYQKIVEGTGQSQ